MIFIKHYSVFVFYIIDCHNEYHLLLLYIASYMYVLHLSISQHKERDKIPIKDFLDNSIVPMLSIDYD